MSYPSNPSFQLPIITAIQGQKIYKQTVEVFENDHWRHLTLREFNDHLSNISYCDVKTSFQRQFREEEFFRTLSSNKFIRRTYTSYVPSNFRIMAKISDIIFNGMLHHPLLPARTAHCLETGNILEEEWFIAGRLHRNNGPAKILYLKSNSNSIKNDVFVVAEYWVRAGMMHRLDGPAIILNDSYTFNSPAWYVKGVKLDSFQIQVIDQNHDEISIFTYAKNNPSKIKLMLEIIRHNRWLTEDQMCVLETAALFKR